MSNNFVLVRWSHLKTVFCTNIYDSTINENFVSEIV